jgi:hypothetical protein
MTFIITFWNELQTRNEILFWFGLGCLAFALVLFSISIWDDTRVLGSNAWYKPIKFSLSTTLFSWAMAWFLFYLAKPEFTTFFSWSVILLLGFEILYITLQASRGEMSHFNISTGLTSNLYSLMAIAATLVTLLTAWAGVEFFRGTFNDLPDHYLWSIRCGILLFVVFSLQGFVMGSANSHIIGGEMGGEGIPFLNWSLLFGDLRIAHFIGMHALQVIPLLSFYLLKSTRFTLLFAALYGLMAIVTLVQALQGKPLLPG